MKIPTISNILNAHERIKPYVHHTPVMSSNLINELTGAELFFKCENFQKIGAFKIRGATNAVLSLTDEEAKFGVATHSSGNHAQALAKAAKLRNIPAYIVMPNTAPKVKVEAVKAYEGKILFCNPTLQAREDALNRVVEQSNAYFVHPYDDLKVIAGQGTVALELFNEIKELDYIICPIGGGGLLSGTLISANAYSPKTKVVAAEPEGADDAYRSLKEGKLLPSVEPKTIADGLLTSMSELTYHIINKYVSSIETVSDELIKTAMKLIWERMKIIVEPSAAVTLALVLGNKIALKGKRVGLILSGGNVDLDTWKW